MALPGQAASRGRLPELAKYDVIEEIGHGGMATVYRAHDGRLGRDVAIKLIHPHLRDSLEIAHRFFVEAKAVAKLRHPNIVEVYDVSAPDDREQYLVVELLRGRTLRKILQEHKVLPPEVAAAIGLELLAALAHAHGAGVIHRDIKPENVIIEFAEAAAAGERVKVKLTDFGIAKLLDAQGVTSTGQVLGSPAHMAPEQIEGGDVDARADVFGLGVLLYECMVGHLPFEGSNPAQVLRRVLDGIYPSAERERPTVGKPWSVLLDRALSHDPAGRFKDASSMRDALAAELSRVGDRNGRAVLEAWSADPETFTEEHERELIETLCRSAAQARRVGDSLTAASDYNRALAYAPHDKELLRIVATMHRADARTRLVRRIVPVVGAMFAFGVAAFFVTRAVTRANATAAAARTSASASTGAEATPPPSNVVDPAASAAPPTRGNTGAASQGPRTTSAGVNGAPNTPPARNVVRDVTIDQFRPQFGVTISVDDNAPTDAHDGIQLPIDGQSHVLHFACKEDACEPEQHEVASGEQAERLPLVGLKIKAATLVIDGDPHATYRLREDPSLPLLPGRPARVAMVGAHAQMRVIQDPSGAIQPVTLFAGKESHVSFSPP